MFHLSLLFVHDLKQKLRDTHGVSPNVSDGEAKRDFRESVYQLIKVIGQYNIQNQFVNNKAHSVLIYTYFHFMT